MKLWRWQDGRQENCRYLKLPLWSFKIGRFGTDGYILKYDRNTILPEHKDPVNGKHWRMNIGWGNANFSSEKYIFAFRLGKFTIAIFRPDIYRHSLYIFEKTTKLSIGWAILNKK